MVMAAGAQEPTATSSVTVINAWPGDGEFTAATGQASAQVPYLAFVDLPAQAAGSLSIRSTSPDTLNLDAAGVAPGATVVIGPASEDGRLATLRVLADTRPTPDGAAALRVVNAAPDLAAAVVVVDGQVVRASPKLLESSGYQTMAAGSHLIEVRVSDGAAVRSVMADLAAGSVYTVLLRGFGERAVGVDVHLDATGLTKVPRGFVRTDLPAPPGRRRAWLPLALLLASATIACVVLAVGRRHRRVLAAVALTTMLSACQAPGSGPPSASTASSEPPSSQAGAPASDAGLSGNGVEVPPTNRVTSLELPQQATARPDIPVAKEFVELGLDGNGLLEVPNGPVRIGWYAGGPLPGEPGPAVLAAHVNAGPQVGVFGALDRIHPGDIVKVEVGGKHLSFNVYATATYDKDRFPAAAVYAPTPGPELRLITCTGTIEQRKEGRVHADNLVVFARLV